MALKILLADDSMTAQNMGRKILVDGGYDVVTVSNGAAAVKKVTELKPDLVILDVYMPGYTGLEVCERVKNGVETAKTPVLLTVGKMEPFKPEDGHRVRADGLLIKPFEATDLLTVVKKLTEKAQAAPAVPEYEQTVKLDRSALPDFSGAGYEPWKSSAAEPPEPAPEKISVPEEMMVVPAMGADILEAHLAPEPEPAGVEETAMAAAAAAASSAFAAVEAPEPQEIIAAEPAFTAAETDAFTATAEAVSIEPFEPAPAQEAVSPFLEPTPAEATETPFFEPEVESVAPAVQEENVTEHELEPTAAPKAEVTSEALPDLEPTILQDQIPVQVAPDEALVTEPDELAQFTTKFGAENAEDIPVGIADAAIQALNAPPEEATPVEESVRAAEPVSISEEVAKLEEELQRAFAAIPAESAPEPQPAEETVAPVEQSEPTVPPVYESIAEAAIDPVESAFEAPAEAAPPVEITLPESATEPVPEEPAPAVEEQIAAEVELAPFGEAIAPAAAQPASTSEGTTHELDADEAMTAADAQSEMVSALAEAHGLDESVVAEIVGRVMERLKPELITEITKKLKEKF